MRKKITFLFFVLFIGSTYGEGVDSILHSLDLKLQQRNTYQSKKVEKIRFLEKFLAENQGKNDLFVYGIYEKLFEEYKSYKGEPAFDYANKMIATGRALRNDTLVSNAKIKISFSMLSAGLFKETLDTLNSIDAKSLPYNQQLDYYNVLMRANFDLSGYVNSNFFGKYYGDEGMKSLEKLLALTEKDTYEYLSLQGLKYLRIGDMKNSRKIYEKILSGYKLTPHQYAIEASSLSFVYRQDNMLDSSLTLLAKAAISDIESCTKETVALLNLSELLFSKGYTEQPFNYIKYALEDAYFYGAKQRKIQISDILPIIEKKQLSLIKSQNSFFVRYSIIVTILIILIILFSYVIIKQFKRLQQTKNKLDQFNQNLKDDNNKLIESHRINAELIGHFFVTIAHYIRKIETFTVTVDRRLVAKKYDEIKNIIDNVNINDEREELYKSFDEAFLKIFPNFISNFNNLFNEEDKIVLQENEPMSVELRIFALIRLGITDNEKIAKILNYSVNTVYSYKTKVRNKSKIPNEEFESKLMEIME